MEYRVMKGEIPVCETILDTSAEQPIDLDFSLPDYCPDIQKILKCQIYPTITEQTISDRLDVEGEVLVKLLYLDSGKKAVRCCELCQPFFHVDRSEKSAGKSQLRRDLPEHKGGLRQLPGGKAPESWISMVRFPSRPGRSPR